MKIRDRSALFLLGLILVILALQLVALDQFLYWKIWWYDILMHVFGGIWIASATIWFIYFSGYLKKVNLSKIRPLFVILVSVLIIGILWEIFEYASGATYGLVDYWSDTFSDIFSDLVGGLVVYLFTRHLPLCTLNTIR